jgi:hypothetical protein
MTLDNIYPTLIIIGVIISGIIGAPSIMATLLYIICNYGKQNDC